MSLSRRTAFVTLLAAACLVVAAVAAVLVMRRAPQEPPAEQVPAAWAEFRTSLGHTQHVGKGSIVCKDCHDYEREGFKDPGVAPCARCHAKEASRAHMGDDATKTDCLTCHAFAPKQIVPTCISCHAQPEGHLPAIGVHASLDCKECHSAHATPWAIAKDCSSCHKETAANHANHAGSAGCADCHKPHAPAVAALGECVNCHANKVELTALHGGDSGGKPGHEACTNCHKPHEFAADPSVCVTCHGAKPTLMASTVQAHGVCTSCHAPHAPAAAAASCAGCHSGIQVAHADQKACITCHAPHTGDVNLVAVTCTSCHEAVGTSDIAAHAGKTPCESCHKPHDFTPPTDKLALCAGCHATELASVALNKGHAACTTCHGADTHKPAKPPACGTCHAKEQASAPKGHQVCVGCHDPHSGNRLPKAASCTNCHADKVSAVHGSAAIAKGASAVTTTGPALKGCETCHRAHGPAGIAEPPACTTCHVRAELPALHGIAAHDTCANCHTSHAAPRSDRATCTTSCHADRRQHQPDAPTCSGCHVFRK